MTIIEFAKSRDLDWMAVYDFLKGSGATVREDPRWAIEPEWLEELRREFTKDSTLEEDECPLTEIEKSLLDEETQRKLDEEKAGEYLKNPDLDTALIDIDPKQLTLDIVIRRLEHQDEIRLDPEFQRGANLWDKVRQSKLIESILIKLPLPAFYFDASDHNSWAVVDGLQRLSAIKNFVVLKKLRLEGLDFLPNLNGKGYDDLPRPLHRRIQETVIFAFLIKPGTPTPLKYNIFKRINTGGLILTPQEIRHALNQGTPASTLRRLAELDEFQRATGYSLTSNKRMVDRDYINRFVAFFLQGYNNYERGPEGLDGFLNKGMSLINDQNKDFIEHKFVQAMQTAWEVFESDAFRKRYEYPAIKRRKPLNKALFEIWAVNLANLSASECATLIERKEHVARSSSLLLDTDKYFDVCITYATGDANRVRYRFEKIQELIQAILTHHD